MMLNQTNLHPHENVNTQIAFIEKRLSFARLGQILVFIVYCLRVEKVIVNHST